MKKQISKVVSSVKSEPEKQKIELLDEPIFTHQGNFTICHISAKKTGRGRAGEVVYDAYGVSKRNPNEDTQDNFIGEKNSLSRAVEDLLTTFKK